MTDENAEGLEDKEIYGLKKAVETAWDTLNNQSPEDIIKRTLCLLGESSNTLMIQFLGTDYTIQLKERSILTSDGKPFHNRFIIGIILHYLIHAKNIPLGNKFISFRELWGGNEYYYAFNNRVLKPLTELFGDKAELLIKAGGALGGQKIEKGEAGITIPTLARVPVTVLVWGGDEEVQPSANVLFDASANEQMETEGLVWLSIAMVSEFKKIKNLI